jgi:hypothetical protein
MDYNGPSKSARVKIKPGVKFWEKYAGQSCDATLYPELGSLHINSEQLKPPLPKWQSLRIDEVEVENGKS